MEEAKENLELITQYFADFTPAQLRQLAALEALYNDWNSKINVISRKDIGALYEKHVLHSLSIAAVFEFPANAEIIDIGTGGGFPGIPLAIFFPDVKFHLVDSIGKKLKVVDSIASELGLTNVTTRHTRAEDIKNRKFDFAVSRAVAPLSELWKWAKPLLRRSAVHTIADTGNGENAEAMTSTPGLICLKGGDLATEIQESGCRPRLIEISELFDREYFKEKYLLFVPK
ncbi:MAG TPA: 16S rRNA (guanine(527)-N(7))-methyltransferase RsmG [Chitinophagaceae bacterium]|nr:16S rRNA (guanine(527)-N(7))-methyltransferase RsmG [Chitinophagaceae bacterium]